MGNLIYEESMRTIAATGVLFVLGCSPVIDAPPEPIARMSTNRMSTNRLATDALSAAALDAVAAGNIARLSQDPELMYYVFLCALDADARVNVNGIGYAGRFGFAPELLKRAMTLDERRWMWGCLEAHANALGVAVPISVRGDHPNLRYAGELEQHVFPFHEGAFFGNGFRADPRNPPSPHRYSCEGEAIMRNQLGGWMWFRLCGRDAKVCDFITAGWCREAPPDPHACEAVQRDGGDLRCHNPPSSDPAKSRTTAFPGVTTYLEVVPEDLVKSAGEEDNGCEEGEVLVFWQGEAFCEPVDRCAKELGAGARPEIRLDVESEQLVRECVLVEPPDSEDLGTYEGHGDRMEGDEDPIEGKG